MANILLNRIINKDAASIFSALTEQDALIVWFAPHVIASPLTGTYAAFAFEGNIYFKVWLKEVIPNRSVIWEYAEGNLDWNGSKISFLLDEREKGKTSLTFNHSGLPETIKLKKWKHSWQHFLDHLTDFVEKK